MFYNSKNRNNQETKDIPPVSTFFNNNVLPFSTPTLSKDYKQIKLDLLRAIAEDEIEVYYQPQICTDRQSVTSVEALARWHHPQQGLIPPTEFIPVAEDLGLISDIDELVLRKACHHVKSLQKSGLFLAVAVNLSVETFQKTNLIAIIKSALADSKLEAEYLELELTETMILPNSQQVLKTMKKLKALGIKLSLDDFGTGYSGLVYLQQFPWDTVKIDRCFIHNLANVPKNGVIIKAIIALARNLNLDIIAEGIEVESDLHYLMNNNCYRSQGYLFSPPVIADKLIQTIHKINYQLAQIFPTQLAA